MPARVIDAIVATLAGFGACFLFLLLLLASFIGWAMIEDYLRNRRKKPKTIEELKEKWQKIAVEKH